MGPLLRATGKSPRTISSYTEALDSFTKWVAEHDRPVRPDLQRRADVEDFIAWLIETRSTGSAGVRSQASASGGAGSPGKTKRTMRWR